VSPIRRRYKSLPLERPGPRDEPALDEARSQEACPACGEHALSLIDFPEVSTQGVQPYSEILGMGEPRAGVEPGIGCLSCGAEWRDLDAFRRDDRTTERREARAG
jgi:hypothetical protein